MRVKLRAARLARKGFAIPFFASGSPELVVLSDEMAFERRLRFRATESRLQPGLVSYFRVTTSYCRVAQHQNAVRIVSIRAYPLRAIEQ